MIKSHEQHSGARKNLRVLLPYIAAGLAVAITCYIFWPGFMSYDSVYQLQQARFGRIDNAHPALMIHLWTVLDGIYPGPGLLLLVHNIVFFFALAYIVKQFVRPPLVATGLILASAFFPPTLGLLGVAWKDIGMMAFFLAGCAFLLRADIRRGRAALALGILFTFFGVASRWNAFPAAMPMWVYAAALISRRFAPGARHANPIRAFFVSAAVFVVIAGLSIGTTIAINDYGVKDIHLWAAPLVFDLLGGSRFAGANLLPAYTYDERAGLTQQEVKALYDPRHILFAFPPHVNPPKLLRWDPQSEEEEGDVLRAWLDLVIHHPSAYVQHRVAFAKVFFGVAGERVFYPTHYGVYGNSLGIRFQETWKTRLARTYTDLAAATPLYRTVFLYPAGAALAGMLLGWHRRLRGFVSAIGVSAMLFIGFNLLVLPAADFRYHSWSVAVVLVLGMIGLGRGICRLNACARLKK